MITWTEKYRPKSFNEIIGQDEAILKIKSFIKNFPNKKKAVIIHGEPGTGKTTLALVLAKETDSEIFEINASDLRDKERLQLTLRPAIEQKSLTKKNKIILIDEADGMTGTDRGGINEILKLIEITEYPIIMTANDVWAKKIGPLRKMCEMIETKKLDYKIIKNYLFDILRKENKFVDYQLITNLAVKARGDLRAALNDLQTVVEIDKTEKVFFDERNKEMKIFDALKKIFKLKATNEITEVFDSLNMDLDEIILWIEKNIPKEYSGKELKKAYDFLSEADIFKGRIYRKQYWRFLVYESIFLSYGIASVKRDNRIGFTIYQKPTRILKIWMYNQRVENKKKIAEKYAKHTHISQRKILQDFEIIKRIIKSNPNIQRELKLDEKEIEYLKI